MKKKSQTGVKKTQTREKKVTKSDELVNLSQTCEKN